MDWQRLACYRLNRALMGFTTSTWPELRAQDTPIPRSGWRELSQLSDVPEEPFEGLAKFRAGILLFVQVPEEGYQKRARVSVHWIHVECHSGSHFEAGHCVRLGASFPCIGRIRATERQSNISMTLPLFYTGTTPSVSPRSDQKKNKKTPPETIQKNAKADAAVTYQIVTQLATRNSSTASRNCTIQYSATTKKMNETYCVSENVYLAFR